jgi:hypothetical protein
MTDDRLIAACRDGDRLQALEALRDGVAERMQSAPAREYAALARRMQAILCEIDEVRLIHPAEPDFLDRLVAGRNERRAKLGMQETP